MCIHCVFDHIYRQTIEGRDIPLLFLVSFDQTLMDADPLFVSI